MNSLKVGLGARPWGSSPWLWYSHYSCTCMFIFIFSSGLISIESVIKMFVLCFLINICLKLVNLSLNFAGSLSFG